MMERRTARHNPRKTSMSLDDVAHAVEQQCGMSLEDAHALLEDVLTEVGHMIDDIAAVKGPSLGYTDASSRPDFEAPDTLPYTEEWDPDFDPRKGWLLLRSDGETPPRSSE